MTVKLDKATKSKLIKTLSHPWGRVNLMCDGRKITLDVGQYAPLKFNIMIYIDERFKGEWCLKDGNHPESKYLYVKSAPLYSASKKAKIIKALGVREAKKYFELDRKIEALTPCFPSANTAINHLCKVCDSIEVIDLKPEIEGLEDVEAQS